MSSEVEGCCKNLKDFLNIVFYHIFESGFLEGIKESDKKVNFIDKI